MKKLQMFACATLTGALMTLTSAFTPVPAGDGGGVFALGQLRIDLAKGDHTVEIATKESLIANIKSGFSFTGNGACAGTYEITGMLLLITTDKEDVSYTYDLEMMRKMQTMEEFMLVRYFNDARNLHFTEIIVTSTSGESRELPDVIYSLR